MLDIKKLDLVKYKLLTAAAHSNRRTLFTEEVKKFCKKIILQTDVVKDNLFMMSFV